MIKERGLTCRKFCGAEDTVINDTGVVCDRNKAYLKVCRKLKE